MDARQFLAEFGHIAYAPNGIAQLREFVLCLAMQGKLVPQKLEEASSTALLLKVEQDKAQLISSGAIKPPKPLPSVTQSDISHALPPNWAWVRFGEIAMHNSGKTLDSMRNSGQPRDYITTSNLYWGRFELSSVKKMLIRDEELAKCAARKNDLLICEGGEAGRVAVWTADTEVCFQNHVHRARFYGRINPFFAYRFFEKLNYTGEIDAHRKGIGISNMSSKALAMIPFPLPPIEEQARIVAKVDELMALCDKLETQQQQRRSLQNNLRQSTLQAVAASSSPQELQASWTRFADNFGRLFNGPEDVGDLRGLILDMAVHGFLVEQYHSEEPIVNWLERIATRKKELIKLKEISKQTALAGIDENDYPFTLPNGWAFTRLGSITNKIGSGSTPRGGREVYVKEGVPFLRSQNVWNEGLRIDDVAFITPEEHQRMSGTTVQANDVLLNITGASLGRCALVPADFSQANVSQHVTIIRPTDPQIRAYLHLCILSPYTQSMIWRRQVGMAREGLSKKVLEQFEIPLPPIPEQHRIVKRVTELMKICDRLEEQFRSSIAIAERVASSTVATITGITTESEEDEPLKAPKTELIAPLRLGTPPSTKEQAPLAAILAHQNGEMAAKDLWQRFGGDIDAFYAQLKLEVGKGWIEQPSDTGMREAEAC